VGTVTFGGLDDTMIAGLVGAAASLTTSHSRPGGELYDIGDAVANVGIPEL
jgi:hypothetical protein